MTRLRLLSALGADMKRCYRCDLNLAKLQPLLLASGRVCQAVYEAEGNAEGRIGREILPIISDVLHENSHIDPQIAELSSYLPKSIQTPGAGDGSADDGGFVDGFADVVV